MAIAEDVTYDACLEQPYVSTAGRMTIRPAGFKHGYSIQNIPSHGLVTWHAISSMRPQASGVEGIVLVVARADNTRSEAEEALEIDSSLFLRTVYFLDDRGYKREAADLVIDKLDDLLNAGEFRKCDGILRSAVAGNMSDLIVVTFLGITLAAKSKLPARKGFYSSALAAVTKRRGTDGAEKLLNKYR